MHIRHFSLIAACLLLAVVTTGEEFDIGTQGATIELDESWDRTILNPDLGPDQFVSIKGFWCLVTEFEGLIDGRQDLDRNLAWVIDTLPPTVEILEERPVLLRDDVDGAGWVTRRLVVRLIGTKLAYQFDMVGRDGLAYLVTTWSLASRENDLHDWASRIARGLSMPSPESEWSASVEVFPETFHFGQNLLEIAYRRSLLALAMQEEGDTMRTLESADGELALHFGVYEIDGRPDDHLDDVLQYLDEGPSSATETDRSTVETPLGPGRQLRADFLLDDGTSSVVAVAAVPLLEDLILDLRMVAMASTWCEHREEHWARLLSTIRFTQSPDVDAFPEAEPGSSDREALNGPAAAIVEGSEVLGETNGWGTSFFVASDGRLYAHEGDRIVIPAVAGADELVLVEDSDWMPNRILDRWSGIPVTLDSEWRIAAIEEHQLVPLGITADRFAVVDDDRLLLVPRREPPSVFGFESLPVVESATLVEYSRTGDVRSISNFGNRRIEGLEVALDGRQALVAVRQQPGFGTLSGAQGTELHLVDLDRNTSTAIESWQAVSRISASSDGWLVSGSPGDRPQGLYLMSNDGRSELLMSGEVEGLSLEGGVIRFAANLHFDAPDAESPSTTVYESPVELIREYGPLCRPFTADTLNLIVDRMESPQPGIGTAEGRKAYLDAADAASLSVAGLPLPVVAAAVDHLLSDLAYQTGLGSDGVTLLTVLFVEALSEAGAMWIGDASSPGVPQTWDNGWVGDNLHAAAIQPHQVVFSTLFSEEGWWRPVSEILDTADGREIFMGFDQEALLDHLDDRTTGVSLAEALALTPKKIGRLFAREPDNVYLRQEVYRYLAANSRFEHMEALSDSIIRDGEPAVCDWQAWAAARNQIGGDGHDSEAEIARLRDAVSRHAEEPALFLLLGRAYERSQRVDRRNLARACYLRVGELYSWGDVSEEAQAALQRLDDEAPPN